MSTVIAGGGNGITGNVSSITAFNAASEGGSNDSVRNLLYGAKWGSGLGSGVTLTTSFATSASQYNYGHTSADAFSASEIGGARYAMNQFAGISGVKFSEVADTASSAGDIRWGNGQATQANPTAYAYYPGASGVGGDIWFGTTYASSFQNPVPGNYGQLTFVHELGHALGLMHPHEGTVAPKPGEDQLKYSVMSYRDFAGDGLDGYASSFFPTTPMINDILAMQYLYGANTQYKSGNDTYNWATGSSVYQTIWDGGGTDTIDASNQTLGVRLDLNPGQWSQIGTAFWNGQAYVRDCLTIAYNTTIENATGSAHGDTLVGNGANNVLRGLAGNDTLSGGGGKDQLVGGAGSDTLDGGAQQDTAIYASGRAGYTVSRIGESVGPVTVTSAAEGADSLMGVERIQFTDLSLAFDTGGYVGQIYRLYQAAFSREPDAGGQGFYMKLMEQGTALTTVAGSFIASPEFQSLYGSNPSDTQYVTALYRNVLDRDPDSAGLAYHVQALQSGTSRAQLLVNFSESPENQAANILDADGNSAQLYRLYDAAFDRAPDLGGLAFQTQAMNGGATLQSIAGNFMQSPEFQSLYGTNLSDGQFVTVLYHNVLERDPDAAGYNYQLNALAGGLSRAQLMINFSESPEHRAEFVGVIKDWVEFVPA